MIKNSDKHKCTIGFTYLGLIIGIIAGKKFNIEIPLLLIGVIGGLIIGFLMDKIIKS